MSDIIDGAYEYKKMLLRSDEVDTKCATRKVLAQGIIENTRDLKIPRRDEPGRLPEVNLLDRACAEEL